MVFDRNENEPEEWDPEEEFYDPDSDGLTIPQVTTGDDESDDPDENSIEVDIPRVSTSETDAPNEIVETFWVLVLVINVAVLVVSLGLMLVMFEGDLRRGGALLVAGFFLFGLAGRRYRGFSDGETTERDASTERDATTGSDTEADDALIDNAETAEPTADEAAETAAGDGTEQRPSNRNDRS
uniref:DUF7322 domain-containing protein n=1 Tax=Natrinema zhouii TaxID=1710539 RepID=A0A7D6CU46_9EURY